MASLADVSRRAGTSVATASRVLNGSTHPVSAETRARVLAAAAEVGYAPSPLAQALVTRSSRIIGVIVNDIVDPYFAEIVRGVEDVAGRMGYLVMVCNAERRPEAELEYITALREYHAEGLVFAGSGTIETGPDHAALSAQVDALRERGAKVVALARRNFAAHLVHVDNTAAAYDITDYLISLKHERIAWVNGPAGLHTSREREDGFIAAMQAAGLPEDLRLDGGFDFEAGLAAAGRLLARRPLPDAVVAANDEAAIGVLTAFRQAGIDVPGQVSVAGIDDTRPARFVELSTVNLPLHQLGAVAARQILARGDGDEEPGELVLSHRLVPRGTTARRRP
jgi:LacI family transcriptional regulator